MINNVKSIGVVRLNKNGWAVRERRRDGAELFVYASSTPGGYTMHQASAAADSLRRHLAGNGESYAEPLPEGVRVVRS